MKRKATAAAARGMVTQEARFERWLLDDTLGLGKPRNGSNAQQMLIHANLERAARAPFDDVAKVSVLSSLFMSSMPQKSLLVLKALREMAVDGSEAGREAFEELAMRWLSDKCIERKFWAAGALLIVDSAHVLDSPHLMRALRQAAKEDPEVRLQIRFWKDASKKGCTRC